MASHYLDCAAQTRGLGGSKKLVLMAIADSAAGDTRISSPGLGEIMAWAEAKKSYTMRLIGELVEEGLLARHRLGCKGRTAEYIVFPHGCCATHGPLPGRRAHASTPVDPLTTNGSTPGRSIRLKPVGMRHAPYQRPDGTNGYRRVIRLVDVVDEPAEQ